MVSPHVSCLVVGEVAELGSVGLVWPAVGQGAVGSAARRVHCQGHIAAAGPMLNPGAEGFAAASMHEDQRGERAFASRGPAKVGKDAGWLSSVGLALVIDLLDQTG